MCGLSRQVTRQMQQARKAAVIQNDYNYIRRRQCCLVLMCVETGTRQPEFTACSVAL